MKLNRYIITTLTSFGREHWTVFANSKASAISHFLETEGMPRRCIKDIELKEKLL